MATRWRVLVLLFLVRVTMPFQFLVVGALSPLYQEAFGVTIADIGLLIGLFFTPGLFLAVLGGALGRRLGDKPMVLVGLALMAIGSGVMAMSEVWAMLLAGRLIAGLGGVLLYVLLTKMIADWFTGKEITFAMALFVNSWPVGIALALVILPMVAGYGGFVTALNLVTAMAVAGFIGLALFYRTPEVARASQSAPGGQVRGALLGAVLAAGTIWGLYNAALSIVFNFGPELFVTRGMALAEAGSVTSIIFWLLAIGGSFAAFLVDWTGRRNLILVTGNLGFAVFVFIGSFTDQVLLNVIAMGVFSGIAVGAMMSLPALVLPPAARAVGMGVFFTAFFVFGTIGPIIAGWLAELTGDIASTYRLSAGLLVASVLFLPLYHKLAARVAKDQQG